LESAINPAERSRRMAGKRQRAAQMIVHGFGEKDIHLVGVILAAKGYYSLNMRDITSMGIPNPGGEKYRPPG
jgi:hypothetical protein